MREDAIKGSEIEAMRVLTFFLLITPFKVFAINTVADGFKVDSSATVEIDAHSTCKEVTNSSGTAQFVATKTSGEWSSFLAHLPSGMTVADCIVDCVNGSPSPGDTCTGGAIYLGSLSPGALDGGSGTDHYMTTPGGCTNSANPTCSGTDSLAKVWYGSGGSDVDIPDLVSYSGTYGTEYGATNTDQHYGVDNTAAILAHSSIGPDSAAAYCDNLNYGGYTDWYLPNRYELNLFYTNKAFIPGLNASGSYYWSSTESSDNYAWVERFYEGYQAYGTKAYAYLVRCIRRYQ